MSGKMMDYLTSGTADYAWLLDIDPQNEMDEVSKKTQVLHEFDDGSVRAATFSDQSFFDLRISFSVLSVTEANTIIDLWNDSLKANGIERTFYWVHPIELDIYVVRFLSLLKRKRAHSLYLYSKIEDISLRVERYALSGVI